MRINKTRSSVKTRYLLDQLDYDVSTVKFRRGSPCFGAKICNVPIKGIFTISGVHYIFPTGAALPGCVCVYLVMKMLLL